MSIFAGALDMGEFHIEDEIGSPSVWDVLTFIGGGFLDLLAFSIPGMPWFLSLIFWVLLLIETWVVVCLIRGVS